MQTVATPENSGWKPAPISISEPTRPPTASVPVDGAKIPASSFRSVDLPDPFGPTIPNAWPGEMSRSTSRSAQSSRVRGSSRRRRAAFSERFGDSRIVKTRPSPRAWISPVAAAVRCVISELDRDAVFVALHHPEPEQRDNRADEEDVEQQRHSRDDVLKHDRPHALDVRRDRVAVAHQQDQPAVPAGGTELLEPVQDRRKEEPGQEHDREKVF